MAGPVAAEEGDLVIGALGQAAEEEFGERVPAGWPQAVGAGPGERGHQEMRSG